MSNKNLNGKTAAQENTISATIENPIAENPIPKQETIKPELSNFEVLAPIEKRIEKFNNLLKLIERREQVQEALQDLKDFQITQTGSHNVRLTDGKGKTFAIAHPIVIGEMVSVAKSRLQDELSTIEAKFII